MSHRKSFSRQIVLLLVPTLLLLAAASGCRSPYHADQGALGGGLLGAGMGAIVGNAVGNTAGGAAIGAGMGALTGAVIGQGMDDVEAKNRAMIEQQLGRSVVAGSVTMDEVIAMTQAGVDDSLVVNHIRSHGMIAPLQSSDLIVLKQQGVSAQVIGTMQAPPPQPQKVVVQPVSRPVIIEEYHYGPGYWGPGHGYHHRYHRRHRSPSVHWSLSN